MNKFKFLFSFIAIAIVTMIIQSCAKDEITKNQSQKSTIQLRTNNPIVANGILKFQNKIHLSDYINDTYSLDDDDRIALESTLGFQSLYSLTNNDDDERLVEYHVSNPNYTAIRNGITTYEKNSIYQIAMNRYNEIWVGNEIYKYVGDNLVVKANDTYVSEIIDIRNNNGIQRDHTTLIDFTKDKEIIVGPRSACEMILSEPAKPTNGNTGYLKISLKDNDGNLHTGQCGGKLTINWGDGVIDSYPENTDILSIRAHQFPLPPFATCITYTVNVTVELSNYSLCSFFYKCNSNGISRIYTSSMTITVCNTASCTPLEHDEDEKLISTHIYNNFSDRAQFYLGYDLENTYFKEPKAWGRIIHYRRSGNNWKKSAPNHRLRMLIHGVAFEDDCENSSSRTVNNTFFKKTKDLKFTVNLDNLSQSGNLSDYHLRNDERLFIDWQVFHISSTSAEPQVLNFPFF